MRDTANIDIVALLVPVLQPVCLRDCRYRKLARKSFAKERFLLQHPAPLGAATLAATSRLVVTKLHDAKRQLHLPQTPRQMRANTGGAPAS